LRIIFIRPTGRNRSRHSSVAIPLFF
jgi:hypothetical protein